MNRALQVLMVVDSLDAGGGERHVIDLAVALRRKGHRVEVACSASGLLRSALDQAGIPLHSLLGNLVKRRLSLRYARELRRLIDHSDFDLVHAHMYASEVAAAIATLGTGVPLVITQHSEAAWKPWWAKQVDRRVYRHASSVIAVSEPIRAQLIDRRSAPRSRVTLISNAVPPADHAISHSVAKTPKSGHLIGVVARLEPEKGVAYFLDAAASMLRELPKCRFLLIGDGSLRRDLETRARYLGLEEAVDFLGVREDARTLLESLDILVVPSLSEGSPLVTLEAMSAGIPVVASHVGGLPDQIRRCGGGVLVPAGDPRALAHACMTLLMRPEYAAHLGQTGRQRAALQFSHADMVAHVERVYARVLGLEAPDPVVLHTRRAGKQTMGLDRTGSDLTAF